MMPGTLAAANVEELRVTEFSDLLRDRASAIWELEHRHPFVVELGNGTLPLEKFQWYMKQDYLFLIDFSRVIAMAVAKADTLEDMGWFARLLHETLNTEMALHVSFCKDFGIPEADLLATRRSPTTLAYVDHMLSSAHAGTIGEIAATLLPCSWGYAEIGQTLERPRQARRPPPLLSLDRNVQLARVRRAGGVAPLVHRPHSDGPAGQAAEASCRHLRREQQVRVPFLGRRLPYGDMARLGVRVYTRSGIRRATGMRPPRNRPAACAVSRLWLQGCPRPRTDRLRPDTRLPQAG